MKIQLQNTTFYPIIGGIESYIYYVSKTLLSLNHTPTILCSQHNPNLPIQDVYEHIKIIRHPYRYPCSSMPLFDLLHLRWLNKFIGKCEHADAIWSRHPYYCFASCKANLNLPIIYIQATAFPLLHKYAVTETKLINKIYHGIRNWEDYHIEKCAMENCNKIVILSKMRMMEISDFYDFPKDKFKVIPPGIDLEKFKPRKKDEKLLNELKLPRDAKVILCVGRIRAEKNILMLIKAFAKLRSNDAYLVIVGDGPQRQELEEKAKKADCYKRVRFTGLRNDIERFYSIADVFVLPSKYEGFGHVYLEAMASSVPCIALKSDYPNIIVASEEIIVNGKTGYCVDPYSPEDLSEKIEEIISNSELRYRMKQESREICEKNYSWERHVKALIKIVEDVRGKNK